VLSPACAGGRWQQRVRYEIDVTLDPGPHRLAGHELLVYSNHSPDTLGAAWFHAYPNAFKNENSIFAKESAAAGEDRFHFSRPDERGRIDFQSFRCDGLPVSWKTKLGDETEILAELPRAIPPGDSARFDIDFEVRIPFVFSRLGHIGRHYEISQWYPKIAVYDDLGWHADGYHRDGEFYGDFGDFDVRITLPADYTVAASGELVEPRSEIARLDSLAARTERRQQQSSRAEHARRGRGRKRRPPPVPGGSGDQGEKTLRFHAGNVHDFAWFADPRYLLLRKIKDGIRINVFVLPGNLKKWEAVPSIESEVLGRFGEWFCPYPYPEMSVADGTPAGTGSMEYPNVVLITGAAPAPLRGLEFVTTHETAHQWFYGLLGSNEMDEAWLDEGFASYATTRFFERKYGREGNLVHWPPLLQWLPGIGARYLDLALWHLRAADTDREEPILKPSYAFHGTYVTMVYRKGALVLQTLHGVLGDSLFEQGLKDYVRAWSGRHPRTGDLRACLEAASKTDLGPFFDDALRTTKKCDYAITSLRSTGGPGARQVRVGIERKGEMRLPSLPIRIHTRDGLDLDRRWVDPPARGALEVATGSDVARSDVASVDAACSDAAWAEIDPEGDILDFDRVNNRRPRAVRWISPLAPPGFGSIDVRVVPELWYNRVDHLRLGGSLYIGNPITVGPLVRVGIRYGVASRAAAYTLSGRSRLGLDHHRGFLDLLVQDDQGMNQQAIGLSACFRRYLTSPSSSHVDGALYRNDVYRLRYLQPGDFARGVTEGLRARFEAQHRSLLLHIGGDLGLRVAGGASFQPPRSTALLARASVDWTFLRDLHLVQGMFVGNIAGTPVPQNRIYLAGDLDPDQAHWFPARTGRLAPLEHWHIAGGPDLLGYFGTNAAGVHPSGRAGAGWNIRLRFGSRLIAGAVFYDIGNVWETWSSAQWRGLRQDAGFGLQAGPLDLALPLWVGTPLRFEPHWKFRWLIGLRSHWLSPPPA
jgi:hypothetical protein